MIILVTKHFSNKQSSYLTNVFILYSGWASDGLGDVNGDTILDVAVSAVGSEDGGSNIGSAFVLFLNVIIYIFLQ